MHYFRCWRELRPKVTPFLISFSSRKLHYFRCWRELRHSLPHFSIFSYYGSCCTISVVEGNYDRTSFSFSFFVSSSFCCTISVVEGNYDSQWTYRWNIGTKVVALFPLLKGITTPFFIELFIKLHKLLHYFRCWRELRRSLSFLDKKMFNLLRCTISVVEGNYDIIIRIDKSITTQSKSCTISVFEGNYDKSPRWIITDGFWDLNCCTISFFEGNYDFSLI